MADNEFNIKVDETTVRSRTSRGKKQPKSKLPLIIGGNIALAAFIVGIYFFVIRGGPADAPLADASINVPVKVAPQIQESAISEPKPAEPPPRETILDDDGETLWASPTTGEPISLRFFPPGTPLLLQLRPAELLAHPEGGKVITALGPWGEGATKQLEALLGYELSEVETLLLGVVTGQDNQLDVTLRAELTQPVTLADLQGRLPTGSSINVAGRTMWQVGNHSYFVPEQSGGTSPTNAPESNTLVICPTEFTEDAVAAGQVEPMLVRDLQRLLPHTDSDRCVTLLLSPRFLDAGGSRLLVDAGERVRDALDWLMDREATAMVVSMHWDENFFAELRTTPQLQAQPQRYSKQLEERLTKAASLVEDQVIAGTWPPFGRKVLARFPAMLRKFAGYTRGTVEDRHVVLRTYLPLVAGHNLLAASELLLTQSSTSGGASTAAASAGPQTLKQRLARVTTLSFPKDTLEQAIKLLSEDLGVPIQIQGSDLQLEGITKNQSFGIDLRNKPGEAILQEILKQANPDRTASGLADPKQKLVYVIREQPDRIEVTTRSSAKKRGDALPAVFESSAQ
ncbi:hypothetical protein [Adhaeretor mobilis]|uniref:Uncharacterized protein n=1 Tax=Adhaeretor mobilis TaxID=1930276 RepID=A0A517MYZ1_9BACT|nr:hypothetical protein [Adhaeretor mobilis]QDT00090.1 hypothetical protein HG15A2_34250 [Adhaeretor mobilis]